MTVVYWRDDIAVLEKKRLLDVDKRKTAMEAYWERRGVMDAARPNRWAVWVDDHHVGHFVLPGSPEARER